MNQSSINEGHEISVVNIPLYKFPISRAVKEVIDKCADSGPNNLCISATGAHGIIYAQKNNEFKKLLNNFFINLPDGMPGVWVGRAKGASTMDRCYGPDFFAEMMVETSNKSISHFLCGGMEGVADRLKVSCLEKFNNDNIVGTLCPPFRTVNEFNYEAIAKKINKSGADIVWVGISTPKQEQFAFNLAKYTKVKFLITVGAAFDFHIGNVKQAPEWMQKNGLEWFYRFLKEPKRLWKRYIEIVPLFAYYGILDVLKFKFENTNIKNQKDG